MTSLGAVLSLNPLEVLCAAMSQRQHFLCEFLIDGRKLVVIWYDDTTDGLLLNADGRLASFANPEQARLYAECQAISIQQQAVTVYDFDRIAEWCRQQEAELIDCAEFLDVWNMLHDIVLSIGGSSAFQIADSSMDAVYEKIFLGANILCDQESEHYIPVWYPTEIEALRLLFDVGIAELRLALST